MSALAALVTPGCGWRMWVPIMDTYRFPVSDREDSLCHSDGCERWASAESRGPCCRIWSGRQDKDPPVGRPGKVRTREADCVLIAGMGGALIQRILSEGEAVLGSVEELILQPQSEVPRRDVSCGSMDTGSWMRDMVEEGREVLFSDGKRTGWRRMPQSCSLWRMNSARSC